MTLAELDALLEAGEARKRTADWQTSRIVAMLVAVNSKHHRYEPLKYMADGAALMREARQARAEREPIESDDIVPALRRAGAIIIDKRKHKPEMTQ